MDFICGIDEAGRGPVIGPLVICGINIPTVDKKKLVKLGIKDSKLIPPKKREELFDILIEKYEYECLIVWQNEIDKELQSEDSNLNLLEAKKSADIIKKLKPASAIIDCPSINVIAYTKTMKELVNNNTKIICEHKADLNNVEVGCASIIAKVTRDKLIKEMHEKHGDFGSGYPSDPKTKAYLEKNYKKHKKIFRTTWQTYKNILEKKKQKSLFNF